MLICVTILIILMLFQNRPAGDKRGRCGRLGAREHRVGYPCYSAILNSSFYAYSAIVDSFVIAFFYVEKQSLSMAFPVLTDAAVLALTNKPILCFKLMFWSRWLLFWLW